MQPFTDSEQKNPVQKQQQDQDSSSATRPTETLADVEAEIAEQTPRISSWIGWRNALQQVLPIYIATHLAFLLLTYFAALFTLGNFSTDALQVRSLLDSWFRWDSGEYTGIATNGYNQHWTPAFFPLYPILERGLSYLTHDPFVAGLIISNSAGLAMLIVLYRLVDHDFGAERAYRTALYLSVFPTAFFFAAAYNETLFMLLVILSLYYMRRGSWWLAGLAGFFATLTRSAGLVLLLPFCYEYVWYVRHVRYVRQHGSNNHSPFYRGMRLNSLGALLIPAGLGLYALYCYYHFHDALAFSHAQSTWHRSLQFPWRGFVDALGVIAHSRILSFYSIHNVLDLGACLFVLVLVVLCFVGPWKFAREHWMYGIFAIGIYIFAVIFPTTGTVPLAAFSRYMLEVFPAFIVLAAMGKKPQINLYYLTISLSLLAFLLLQFLTGRWIV